MLVVHQQRWEPYAGPEDRPWASTRLCASSRHAVWDFIGSARRSKAERLTSKAGLTKAAPRFRLTLWLLATHPHAPGWGLRHVSRGFKLGHRNRVLVAASMMRVMPWAWDGCQSGAAPAVPRKRG